MPYCLIFPGQGTQFPGMSDTLGLEDRVDPGLAVLMREGPAEALNDTLNAQPAVFAVSFALWLRAGLEPPAMIMGHSLGEYTALAASGALTFEEGLALVRQRARLMAEALPDGEGAMAAVIGLLASEVEEVLAGVPDVWIANLNAPSQVVLSGKAASIAAVRAPLKARGARKVVPLKVSVASHCPLMEGARQGLLGVLAEVALTPPLQPVVFNATAKEASDPDEIRSLLARQLVAPLQWEASVRYAASRGITRFVEIGPKSVLAPLVSRILPGARVEVIGIS